jgi:hypothetical protein
MPEKIRDVIERTPADSYSRNPRIALMELRRDGVRLEAIGRYMGRIRQKLLLDNASHEDERLLRRIERLIIGAKGNREVSLALSSMFLTMAHYSDTRVMIPEVCNTLESYNRSLLALRLVARVVSYNHRQADKFLVLMRVLMEPDVVTNTKKIARETKCDIKGGYLRLVCGLLERSNHIRLEHLGNRSDVRTSIEIQH